MKLLIVTQTIDVEDPILGFFVRWVEEFAKNCEQVHVLALNVGSYELPENVQVHSLGKSEGKSKITWLWRLWRHSFQLRHSYDATFVHMNPEYVIYGSLPWRLLRKRVGLWYAHGTVSNKLKLAVAISDNVYTSTSMGLRLETKKKVIVGQGIDINNFDLKKDNAGEPTATIKLITVGRINQSKKIETLINACKSLKEEGIDFCLSIYGQAQNDEEKIYQTNLEERINEFGLRDFVIFKGPVNQKDLPERLHESTFFIQDGRTGSLDKVLLESVACGIITLSSNESYKEFVGELSNLLTFPPGEAELLVELIKELSSNNVNHNEIITKLRNKVKEEHSIEKQIVKITTHLCQKR